MSHGTQNKKHSKQVNRYPLFKTHLFYQMLFMTISWAALQLIRF